MYNPSPRPVCVLMILQKKPVHAQRRAARRLPTRRVHPVLPGGVDASPRAVERRHPQATGERIPRAAALAHKFPRQPRALFSRALLATCPKFLRPPICAAAICSPPIWYSRRSWCGGMSTPGAAWSRNGSRTLDAAATAPGRTLGVGAAAAAPSFGRGSFGHAVGLPPPPRSRGHGRGSVAAATTVPAFSIDGSVGGDFTSSIGPHASSQPWFDAAGGDPSSPGSW